MTVGQNGRLLFIAVGVSLILFVGLQRTVLAPVSVEGNRIADLERQVEELKRDLLNAAPSKTQEAVPIRKQSYPAVKKRSQDNQMRVLVTGGAGFVGSHLVDVLMSQGHQVIVLDNLFTGRKKNIQHWIGHPNFDFYEHDVTIPFHAEVDQIYHLACPASPPHYQYDPIKTIFTSTEGTKNMLNLARDVKARILFTSTSEVYGDPEVHPQPETYWGHVNPIGPRACYDEGKRVAETMCFAYQQTHDVEIRVARIFNTFGPRMHPNDGRVVSNFVIQALQKKPLTIYGSGDQTRSFQYVTDLVAGLVKLMNGNYSQPVNLGNPDEYTVNRFAELIRKRVDQENPVNIEHLPASVDDPQKRRPDISVAKREIGWAPKWKVEDGVKKTIQYFSEELGLLDPELRTSPVWITEKDWL